MKGCTQVHPARQISAQRDRNLGMTRVVFKLSRCGSSVRQALAAQTACNAPGFAPNYPPMKIIDRYVTRQVLFTALMAVAVLSLVLVLGNVFKQLLDLLV